MKITRLETLTADAGWRTFSFLKLSTDAGIVGWSEYTDSESFGSPGVSRVIESLESLVIGRDPLQYERVISTLHVFTRHVPRGGLIQLAIGAIENALLDIKGKELGVPVYSLFGGPVRDQIPVYWSHAATYRIAFPEKLGVPALKTYDDVARHAEEIRSLGFDAMKSNIFIPEDGALKLFAPCLGYTAGWPEFNFDFRAIQAIVDTVSAMRAGAGADAALLLDLNYNFRTEGFIRAAAAVEPFNLAWLEIDASDADALAQIRRRAPCPIASGEHLTHRREFKPFLSAAALDVAIIDVPWTGFAEAMKIASMAETYDINIAPHNYYGHLCTAMSAHLCAAVPNFRILELDVDGISWRDEFVTSVPVVKDGKLMLPTGPGWGIDVNERAVRARSPAGSRL